MLPALWCIRLLVEVGDITVPDHGHLASRNGTGPIHASSGDQVRSRLCRTGNRQINRVLRIMATIQLRDPTDESPTVETRYPAGF
jgi:transposase